MMNTLRTQEYSGSLSFDEPMSRHTSWRVGGPADQYFQPASVGDLAAFLASLPEDTHVHWCGLGSNLLVRDGGIRGAVIATHGFLRDVENIGEFTVRAGAGVACARLAKLCARWGLGPAEFFSGIPGTLGGALAMNAGAFGGETWDHVIDVDVINRAGSRSTRSFDEYKVGYRSVQGPANEWFLGARLRFERGQATQPEAIRALLAKRKDSQPIGLPSCGSVFRNPPGGHAAQLIEASGLKGYSIGGAEVSNKHANFIINTGDATADDIEQLITHVMDTVQAKHDIRLVPEVRIIGETK